MTRKRERMRSQDTQEERIIDSAVEAKEKNSEDTEVNDYYDEEDNQYPKKQRLAKFYPATDAICNA